MARRSLRLELLVSLGFVTSTAVILVGLNTVLLLGGDLREAWMPLLAVWIGSTLVFVLFGASQVHRLVIQPLSLLADEADALARGEVPASPPDYATRELDELAGRYRAMAEELLDAQSHVVRVEKLAGIGRLAAGVAHEIRNPLGALGTYTEVLGRRGSAIRRWWRRCIPPSIGSIALSRDCWTTPGPNPPQAAARASHSVSADLNGAARTAVEFLSAQGMLAADALTVELDPSLGAVRGDRHALEQMVINLLVNAVQAAPRGRIRRGHGGEALPAASRQRPPGTVDPAPAAPVIGRPRPSRQDLASGTPGALLYRCGRRARCARGRPGADLRSVLHYQGTRRGHRPGVGDRGADRARRRWGGVGGPRPRGRRGVQSLPASGGCDRCMC